MLFRSVPKPEPKDVTPAKKPAAQKKDPPQTATQSSGRPSTADILAAARGKKADTQTGRPSTADILAAARGASVSQEEPPAPKEEPAKQSESASPSAQEAEVTEITSNEAKPTTTAEKIAWCRSHDGKA